MTMSTKMTPVQVIMRWILTAVLSDSFIELLCDAIVERNVFNSSSFLLVSCSACVSSRNIRSHEKS